MTRHAPADGEWTNTPDTRTWHDTETQTMTTKDTTTTGVSETDTVRDRTTRGQAGGVPTRAETAQVRSTRTGETGHERRSTAETMGAVDQTNPYTNRSFGFAVYGRGVVTDGGRRQAEESMDDVDHESEVKRTDPIFGRGTETGDE